MSPKKDVAMTKDEFNRLLSKYLAVKGNSVLGMADKIGVTRLTIYRWKRGERRIDQFTADALLKFFKENKIT